MTSRILLAISLLVPLAGQSAAQFASIPAIPASMLQDERAAEYEAIIAESRDSQIEVDLEELSGDARATDLAGLMIRAIAEDGTVTEAISDRNGRATLAVKQQPTVLTATGSDMHMAVLTYPQEVTNTRRPRPVTVPVMMASREVLLRNTEGLAPPPGAALSEELLPLARAGQLPPRYYQAQLTPAGNLQGRVTSIARRAGRSYGLGGMNVSILERGRVIRTAITEPDGAFVVSDLLPGVYGVIASGRAGYGAFGFEAVPSDATLPVPEAVSHTRATVKTVALRQPEPTLELVVPLIPPQMVPAVVDSILAAYDTPPADGVAGPVTPPPFAPFGGVGPGAVGGGGAAGGGGGLLGGGLGGLLVPAAIGAAVLAFADDDDEDVFVPLPASPAVPRRE